MCRTTPRIDTTMLGTCTTTPGTSKITPHTNTGMQRYPAKGAGLRARLRRAIQRCSSLNASITFWRWRLPNTSTISWVMISRSWVVRNASPPPAAAIW